MEEMEDFLNTAPQAAAQNHQQQQFNLNRLEFVNINDWDAIFVFNFYDTLINQT